MDNKKIGYHCIILAAGLGKRIERLTKGLPKSLLKINDKSLLENQLDYLSLHPISHISIIVGYKKEKIKNLIGDVYKNTPISYLDSKDYKGILEKLKRIWQEHSDDDWGEFNNEEITRYICEKITLEETNFLSDKTKDQFRSLYRLIAERIRQYQNTVTAPDLEKFQKKKD